MNIEILDDNLITLVNKIDDKRKKVEEKAKTTSQYKRSGKYKKVDERYLNELMERRNTLVNVVNYIRTDDLKYLKILEN